MVNEIGVIGVGKLGICFALNLERSGYYVKGVDVFPDYVEALNSKSLKSPEPEVEDLLRMSQNFSCSTDITSILSDNIDLLFLCVATPTTVDQAYDHTQIERVAAELIEFGKRNQPVELVVVATTTPGYCDELAQRLAPYNYRVSYNPEFIAQGNIVHDQLYPDQVLIGEDCTESGDKIEAVYRKLCRNEPTFCRMSRLSAEICKLATNCFLTTKISFANSIGDLATKCGAEPDKILSAIGADSRIGGKYLRYGYGFGGPCFPRDNRALGKFARDRDYELLISDATDEVNRRHLQFQVNELLNRYAEDEIIEFESVTYKPGTVITEESQQLELAVELAKAGRKVKISDRSEVIAELRERYGDLFIYA